MAGRLIRSPAARARATRLQEALALTGLMAIAAHGLLLLGDSYLRPGLAGVALPFAMPHRTLWTGLGVLGGWLTAIVGLSFYVRRWIGTRTWRWLHRWTFAVYGLSVVHTLGAGSDARSAWLLAILGATALPIAFAATFRLLSRKRPRTATQVGVRPSEARPPAVLPEAAR
jgi:sulfoxide reductase heme-binding subunit YedZ